jgi:hypothetical protein
LISKKDFQLHPPGRLLRLAIVDEKVEMKWVDYHFLNEIQLTGTIVSDHLPYRLDFDHTPSRLTRLNVSMYLECEKSSDEHVKKIYNKVDFSGFQISHIASG